MNKLTSTQVAVITAIVGVLLIILGIILFDNLITMIALIISGLVFVNQGISYYLKKKRDSKKARK